MIKKKRIAVVTPCFNEIENIYEMWETVNNIFSSYPNYDFLHLFIDNGSTDGTIEAIKKISKGNTTVACIINARNFGYIRSSFYGLLQPEADATILLSCDFQEPPELIGEFLECWEKGAKVVGGIKTSSEESTLKRGVRTAYYRLLSKISSVPLVEHFFDFGLYDRSVIAELRKVPDQKPYLRGLIRELGFDIEPVKFKQQARRGGKTKFSVFDLIDTAITGIVIQGTAPLRILTYCGCLLGALAMLVSVVYLVLKLLYWDDFQGGAIPAFLGVMLFGSFNFIALGLIGEYVANIQSQILKRSLVVEKGRFNGELISAGGS